MSVRSAEHPPDPERLEPGNAATPTFVEIQVSHPQDFAADIDTLTTPVHTILRIRRPTYQAAEAAATALVLSTPGYVLLQKAADFLGEHDLEPADEVLQDAWHRAQGNESILVDILQAELQYPGNPWPYGDDGSLAPQDPASPIFVTVFDDDRERIDGHVYIGAAIRPVEDPDETLLRVYRRSEHDAIAAATAIVANTPGYILLNSVASFLGENDLHPTHAQLLIVWQQAHHSEQAMLAMLEVHLA